MVGWEKKGEVKQQVDYSDVLFRQIDRTAEVAAHMNIDQLAICVDMLAGMVSFLGKINFVAVPTDQPTTKYKKCIKAFEETIQLLDRSGLIFKYRIKGHFGQPTVEEENP